MNAPLLQIDAMRLEFPGFSGSVHAVNGVSLHVDAGEIVGVVGESGSAKSVTVMAALRLLPEHSYRVEAQHIKLLGQDVRALSARQMNRLRGSQVAMIFQEPQTALNPIKKIGAQILRVIHTHTPLRGQAATAHALALLADMRINDGAQVMQRYPFELSGGMRQRVLIAMAFACAPKLLIADEPTTALDVTVQRQVLQLMRAMAVKSNTAILFISHDLALVSQFCQRVYVMYAGSIVESGATRTVLRHPQHPYAQALIRALPESAGRGERLQAIAGHVPDLVHAPHGCAFAPRCAHAFAACSQTPTLLPTPVASRAACWRVAGLPAGEGA